jgi:predicted metal-dependent hydrolase
MPEPPVILAFVADIMFATRIQSAADRLGYKVNWIENAGQVSADAEELGAQLGEPVRGPGADLLELVTLQRPSLMIFDLGNPGIPWRDCIVVLKSASATRRFPILCYGAHVDGQPMIDARSRGADAVMARSKFASDLPGLIQKYARILDQDTLTAACGEPLSDLARRGLELFNHGEYFEAHEVLEAAWNQDGSPGRELYRAVLQVAVAYLQIERRNYNGAYKMFLRVRQWIDPLPDVCRTIQVEALRRDAAAVRERLLELGPDRIGEFDRSLFRPVRYGKGQ